LLLTLPNGKVALQSDTGRYLAICSYCAPAAAYSDAAFVHAADAAESPVQWTLTKLADGKITLKGDNGRYLARCQSCYSEASYADAAFVHERNSSNPWAQWTLVQA
jgi:hypothetical protein